MRKLIVIQYLFAALFVVIGVSVSLIYRNIRHDPRLLQTSQEFSSAVHSITDIEHLRKLVFTIAVQSDKAIVANLEATDAAVLVAASFCAMAAAALLICASIARKLEKRQVQQGGQNALSRNTSQVTERTWGFKRPPELE